jgi:MarR family transcriptional regulator, 2-MHQ and catechol-resistance regulon repressor
VPRDRREMFYHDRIKESGSRYPEFDLLSSQVTLDLLYTYDVLHQFLGRYLADFGLSRSTFNILMLLRHGPQEGMQLHDLGELLLVSRANITGLMDHLEEKAYVRRVVDSSDRRARYARITRKAELLLDEIVPLHYRNIKNLLQDLTTAEKETLLSLLKKTRESLTAHSNDWARHTPVGYQTVEDNEE